MNLTNRSKVVAKKELTLMESMYLPAIVKGMAITLSHLFKRKATIKYPEETREIAPVYRGQHVLKRDEAGAERCTACGLCAVAIDDHSLPIRFFHPTLLSLIFKSRLTPSPSPRGS